MASALQLALSLLPLTWANPLLHYPIEPSFTDTLVEWLTKCVVYVVWRRSVLLHKQPIGFGTECKFLCKLNSSVSLSMFFLHSVKVSYKLVLQGVKSETVELPRVCNYYIKVP